MCLLLPFCQQVIYTYCTELVYHIPQSFATLLLWVASCIQHIFGVKSLGEREREVVKEKRKIYKYKRPTFSNHLSKGAAAMRFHPPAWVRFTTMAQDMIALTCVIAPTPCAATSKHCDGQCSSTHSCTSYFSTSCPCSSSLQTAAGRPAVLHQPCQLCSRGVPKEQLCLWCHSDYIITLGKGIAYDAILDTKAFLHHSCTQLFPCYS